MGKRRWSEVAAHQGFVVRAGAMGISAAFSCLPKALRFRVARILARLIGPVIAMTPVWSERKKLRTDNLAETSLDLLLLTLTRCGVKYDPVQRVEGEEHLADLGAGPVLIASPHKTLSTVIVRMLADRGHKMVVINPDPRMYVHGTGEQIETIAPSPSLLLEVRRLFRGGRIVGSMIDRDRPERRNAAYPTAGGTVYLSHALLQLALRHRVRILFVASRIDPHGELVTHIQAPSTTDPSDLLHAFARFFSSVQAPEWQKEADSVSVGETLATHR